VLCFYNTKSSSISCLLTSDKAFMQISCLFRRLTEAFKQGSSFCSFTRSCRQNEDLIDFVSLGAKRLSESLRFVVLPGLFYKTKTSSISCLLTRKKKRLCRFPVYSGVQPKRLSEGLRFVEKTG